MGKQATHLFLLGLRQLAAPLSFPTTIGYLLRDLELVGSSSGDSTVERLRLVHAGILQPSFIESNVNRLRMCHDRRILFIKRRSGAENLAESIERPVQLLQLRLGRLGIHELTAQLDIHLLHQYSQQHRGQNTRRDVPIIPRMFARTVRPQLVATSAARHA